MSGILESGSGYACRVGPTLASPFVVVVVVVVVARNAVVHPSDAWVSSGWVRGWVWFHDRSVGGGICTDIGNRKTPAANPALMT